MKQLELDLPQWFHPHYAQLVRSRASEYLRGEPLVTDYEEEKKLLDIKNRLDIIEFKLIQLTQLIEENQ